MRPTLVAGLLALALLAGCGGEDEPAEPASTPTATPAARDGGEGTPARAEGEDPEVSVITTGLEVPWDIAFLPDGRALVTERPGRIRLVSAQGQLREAPVAEVAVQAEGEGGLMGLALDPAFADGQPYAYTMVTAGGEVRVLRLRWADGRLTEDAVVLDGIRAGSIHDSGRLRMGPDDRLHVVTGDAGEGALSQDRASRNGKVLALTPRQYRGDGPADPSVISIGHRNPQGLDWRPDTDELYVTEHGPSGFDGPSCCDELNRVRQGGNFAWPRFGGDQPASARPAKLWQDTIAPSGMAFVRAPGSAWSGQVLVAALRGTALHRLSVDGGRATEEEVLLRGEYGRLRAVVEAPDGAVWVSTSNLDTYGERTSPEDDRILRVVPPAR